MSDEHEREPLHEKLMSWAINIAGFILDPIYALIFWFHPANNRDEWWPRKRRE